MEIDKLGRITVAGNRHRTSLQLACRHPLQATINHLDLIFHLVLEVGHLAFDRSQVAPDTLADRAHHRAERIEAALVFDVGRGKERRGDAAAFHGLALHQWGYERRETSLAGVNVDGEFLRCIFDQVGKERVEQELRWPFEVADDLHKRRGIVDRKRHTHPPSGPSR